MSNENHGRDWGYASYDFEHPEDEKLIYTSYENSGKVNQYHDNGDGGHGHTEWNNKDDYNLGKDPNYNRDESDKSENPSVESIQGEDGSGCYLTTACMEHYQYRFNDKCDELEILRWFRDNFVSKEDIIHYYETAPKIVAILNSLKNSQKIYEYIYSRIINACVIAIKDGKYDFAYKRYSNSILALEEKFLNKNEKSLSQDQIKSMVLRKNN